MAPVARYPLSWPVGWKRTSPANRLTAAFGKSAEWYGSPKERDDARAYLLGDSA